MKVSVVTPSLNQGRFIGQTLRSVAAQDIPGLEHVVIDGGSDDATIGILRGHAGDLRWVSEPDRGQAHAVNKGIEGSTGDIIGWLNSDDVYYPGAIAAVLQYFARHPEVDVVYGQADHIDAEGRPYEAYPTRPWDLGRLQEGCFLCQPAVFFRRRAVERFGPLDETLHYCMDYEYWLRLGMGGAMFAYLPRKLAGSRMYPDNKTMSSSIAVHREINEMLLRRTGEVPDSWLTSYAYTVTRSRLDETARPVWFARETSARTLLAALRWNGRVRKSLLRRLFPRWFGSH